MAREAYGRNIGGRSVHSTPPTAGTTTTSASLWDVATYGLDSTQFPRTSTGNRLYGEFDLEAYRALGSEVTRRMLRERRRKGTAD